MNFHVLAVNQVIKVSPLYLTYCVFFLFLPHRKTKPSPRTCELVRINVSPTRGSGFHRWVRWGGWVAVLGGRPASARGGVLAHRYPTQRLAQLRAVPTECGLQYLGRAAPRRSAQPRVGLCLPAQTRTRLSRISAPYTRLHCFVVYIE